MAKFQFPLEPVLSYKRSLEEMLQFELARLQQQAHRAREVRDALKRELEVRRTDLRALMGEGYLQVDEIMRHKRFLRRLTQQLQMQEAVVARLEAQVAEKREELLQVRQEEAVLEALKERQFRRFQQRLERATMQVIDESAIAGFNRRRAEEAERSARLDGA